jgi:flagellin-specific chaperone FliS
MMNTAHNAYRRSAVTQWTRIDLLVALYAATLRTLEAGAEAAEHGDMDAARRRLLHVQRQLLAILDGVQPGSEGGGDNVRRLLLFCLSRVTSNSVQSWRDAARIIGELHSAFSAVQDEARALEQRGAIPALDTDVTRTFVA